MYHQKGAQQQYNRLNFQTPDLEATRIDNLIRNKPFVIINKLPVDISIIQEDNESSPITMIGRSMMLPARGRIEMDDAKDGVILHFQYKDPRTNKLDFVCPSHKILKRTGKLFVGGVTSYTKTYRRDIHPGGDISSINVHNLLPWDIILYTNGAPVMNVQRNLDLGTAKHHGDLTVSPYVYYDNNRQGLKIGTSFEVFAFIPKGGVDTTKSLTKLYSFMIDDIDLNHIFVGDPNPQIDEHTSTGANPQIYSVQHTGRAIYRFSEPIQAVMPGGITGGGQMMGKNYPGQDKHRLHQGNSRIKSTVPSARFKKLSGANIVCSQYL